jgi:hypothetical protein
VTRQPDSWRNKVHPAFIEIAGLRREVVEAEKKPLSKRAEAVERLVAATAEKRHELLKRYPELSPAPSWAHVKGLGHKVPPAPERAARLFEYHFFKRFRIPLALALEKAKHGDIAAHRKILRASDDFWHLGHGYRVLPYKENAIHSDLMEIGLGLGLATLSPGELTECFARLCPCGKAHDENAMQKLRKRVQKKLQSALEESWRLTPPRERFAVFGAGGYIAKAYRPDYWEPFVEISRRGRGLEYIIEKSTVAGYSEESEFSFPAVLSRLPAVFFVQTPEELFKMFFPA